MSGNQRMIGDGTDIIDVEATRVEDASLRREIEYLKRELAEAKKRSRVIERGGQHLRKQLKPMYDALRMLFGELDAFVDSEATSASDAQKWDNWKNRLGPSCSKVIDALLLGGEMNVTALTVTCKMAKQTVYDATSKMGRAGILVNNGGKFSLRS